MALTAPAAQYDTVYHKGADALKSWEAQARTLPVWLLHSVLLAALFYVVSSRRWDALFLPQFWAEDGRYWYGEANARGGLQTVFLPHAGYFECLSRLTAWATQGLPLAVAPLVFNLVALAVSVLPAWFLLTSRARAVFPHRGARIALAILIIALPGTGEVHGNLTNAHTHLALLAALVTLVADAGTRRPAWRAFDISVVLLSGLSGPFCAPLAPLALARWWFTARNDRHLRTLALVTAACAVAQVVALLFLDPAGRTSKAGLGATPELFVHLLGGKVFCAALIGDDTFYQSIHGRTYIAWNAAIALFASALGVALMARAAWKGPRALTLFIAFTGVMFAVALIFPLRLGESTWYAMATFLHCGNRYFFLPMIGFLTALVWLAWNEKERSVRFIAVALLVLAPVGAFSEWTLDTWPYYGHARAAAKFDQAPAGTKMFIPAAPGPDWAFPVTKR